MSNPVSMPMVLDHRRGCGCEQRNIRLRKNSGAGCSRSISTKTRLVKTRDIPAVYANAESTYRVRIPLSPPSCQAKSQKSAKYLKFQTFARGSEFLYSLPNALVLPLFH